MYEIERKFRTELSKNEFYSKIDSKIDKEVTSTDHYFYQLGPFPKYYIRLRKDWEDFELGTLTFKEETEDNFIRREFNFSLDVFPYSQASLLSNMLGCNGSFKIVKSSFISHNNDIELVHYTVNSDFLNGNFVEVEYVGKLVSLTEAKSRVTSFCKNLIKTHGKDLKQTDKSLFKLYLEGMRNE